MIIKFTLLSLALFISGYLLTFYLYKKNQKTFRGSEIQTKIHTWIPIFVIVMIFASLPSPWRFIASVIIIFQMVREFLKFVRKRKILVVPYIYLFMVSLGIVSGCVLAGIDKWLLLSVWLMSVVSDVAAYFIGTYSGSHSLPQSLNKNKSWEGVAGQLIGSAFGFLLLNIFVIEVPIYLLFLVGLGSASGDLANSYVKRLLGIKDWGKTIPGHGGFLDRLSSLSFALFLTLLASQ